MPIRDLSTALTFRRVLTASFTVLLASCGGGSGDGSDEATNRPDQQAQEVAPGNWSDPKTWGGTVPPNGASVVIPAGKTIILDTATSKLANLQIDGVLKLAEKDVALTAGAITVSGTLQAGTEAAPFSHKATITLTGAPGGAEGVSRGLRVTGGKLLLHAVSPQPAWTKLNQHAAVGTRQFQLKQGVDWKAGDQIVVAPTDHYGLASSETFTLASASGITVSTTTGLVKSRWGRLQYPTATGMSLTVDTKYVPPAAPAPTSLDERAAVGNLSRRIVIQGADDDAWRNQGFGAHVMVMSLKSKVEVDGVEFRRVGQAGDLGRYPMHWHTLSYDLGTGTELGDATGHYIRNSAIWDSANRCVVLHATNGVTVQNNICYDIKGHGFFLEDAVERRNVFDGNLALKTRSPLSKDLLKIHEGPEVFQGGPSGFWITNPDNQVTNNLAGDSQGNGIWLSFPLHPLGLSQKVKLWPRYTPLGLIENNTVHSARGPGMLLEWVPVDDDVAHPETTKGTLASQRYVPMKNGKPCLDGGGHPYDFCPDGALRLTIKRTTAFKNRDGAYRNRVTNPDYLEWTVADNVGLAFGGAAQDGTIQRGLFVGTSLNHSDSKYPTGAAMPAGIATYHSMVAIKNNQFIDIPFVDGKTSGAFSAEDYYTVAVERGKARNSGNRLTDASPGFRNLQPGLTQHHLPSENWALSGAIWDTEGQWGPKNWYTVPDDPFLTFGANCVDAKPAGRNGKTCEGEFYGVESIQTDFDSSRYEFAAAINASRQDTSGNEVASWRVENGYTKYVKADVANKYACDTRVTPPPGNFCSWQLGHMRHFAARPQGRYVLSFPGWPAAKWLALNVSNAAGAEDKFLMAVKFDGRLNAAAYLVAGSQWDREEGSFDPNYLKRTNVRTMSPAANLATVQSSNGDKFWQDKANNLVWFKYTGGLPFPGVDSFKKNSDEDLYRMYSAVVYPKDTCTGAGSLPACLARIKALNLP